MPFFSNDRRLARVSTFWMTYAAGLGTRTSPTLGTSSSVGSTRAGPSPADVAFDPAHNVYLVVHGSAVGGAFIDSDGNPAGGPFAIAQTAAWTQTPSVTWFPSVGAFLVVWHDTRENPNGPKLRGRLVGFDGSAVSFPGGDFAIGADTSYQEVAAALACATHVPECLVVWTKGTTALAAQRIGSSGNLEGPVIDLSPTDWNGDAAVAIAPGGDVYFVTHTLGDSSGASVLLRRFRWARAPASAAPPSSARPQAPGPPSPSGTR
ncbi:MAG: hypothetical protein ACYC8T_28055 [Myxococcaceae bacterium]